MRKLIASLAVIFAFAAHSIAQDMIYKSNGEKIKCEITNEDSSYVYFDSYYNNNLISTKIPKESLDSVVYKKDSKVNTRALTGTTLGIGAGFEFGGLGANVLIQLNKNIGVFGGIGYAFAGVGYNVGTKIRFTTNFSDVKSTVNPYATIMYGYNTAIQVKGASEYNKFFYGPSIGFGIDTYSPRRPKGYWTYAINVPIRSGEVNDYMNDLEDIGIKFENELLPIAFTIGYRFL